MHNYPNYPSQGYIQYPTHIHDHFNKMYEDCVALKKKKVKIVTVDKKEYIGVIEEVDNNHVYLNLDDGYEYEPGYRFGGFAGYGSGFGYGGGYGAGYGPGAGYGYGPGYGAGFGPGYGAGFGAGYGPGYGAGFGPGFGGGIGSVILPLATIAAASAFR